MSQAGTTNSAAGSGGFASSFVENIGSAVPVLGVVNILGGVGITTTGSGNTITITNTAVASNLTFDTDSTPAVSSSNTITFHGVGGLLFSGSGATVTGTLAAIPNASLANSSVTVTAGTGLSGGGTVALGGTITLNLSNPVSPALGGTGVANAVGSTITLGGALTTSGAFASTFTMTGITGVTFPTSGTLATTSQLPSITATQYNVLVGGAANSIVSVAPSATAGIPLISQGTSANPLFGTAVVAGGGTGIATFANTSALLTTGTSATGALQNIASVATGQVLISAGASTLPSWSATPTVTGMTITGTPSANTDATNVLYVQTALSTVNPSTSVYAATTVNIPGAYLNGASGIGATFVTTATGTFTLDGTTPPLLSRILFKNQTTTFQNGVYILTTNGTGITGSTFTRAVDYDQASDINSTGVIAVVNGTANQLTGWLLNVTVTNIGIDPITYVLFNSAPVSYPLSLANGGTNAALTASNGGIFYSTASAGAILAGTATANQVLLSGASTTPAWSTAIYPAATTINQILYSSSASVIAGLATANNGVLITSAAGVPSILAAGTTGQVLTATTGSPATWANPATSGTVTSVSGTANQVAVATGTTTPVISLIGPYTPATYTAHGVLIGEGTSSIVALAAGTSGQVLQSGGASADPAYSTATYPATAGTSGNVLTSNGTNWTSAAASGPLGLSSFSVTLTSAQVKAVHGTPIQLVAAPGAGKTIVLVSWISVMNYGGTNAFVASASQTVAIYYGTANATATGTSNASIVATGNKDDMGPVSVIAAINPTNLRNVALNAYNPVATEITGNAAADNTILLAGLYYIITG